MLKSLIAPAFLGLALVIGSPFAGNAAPPETMEKMTEKPVEEAVDAFLSILGRKGATVFAVVEHAKGADSVGMELAPATLVIFGNPKLGTPLMQAAPSMGIDLPMKALFLQEDGGTKVLFTDIAAVAERHGVDPNAEAVQKVAKVLDALTTAAMK